MKNFFILTEAIEFIEKSLCEPIRREEVAKNCHVSLSTLEKLFGYALGLGIRDYITRRRMTAAARDISLSGLGVTQAAMKYQFGSPDVFSRAFRRVWGVNPSEFAKRWKFTGLFPKINYEMREGESLYMARKRVDISEAYDFLRERRGSYVLCFDMRHMTAINEVSQKAGDLAILEMAARIDAAAGENMLLLRIGGDEFALVTGLYGRGEAEELRKLVLSKNGECIGFEGRSLPLSLWCGIAKIPENLHYAELFDKLHGAIEESKS